ncbi:hypothetical protein BOTBODRAFT_318417 [Botryobasidium botryosum FD-172 SS1]|uniref:Uncharacterized protein n=1 Tax=Botryobasidium botryosum (strain FD-172 SS1) TaxID=930990 RepID=A0A067N1F9_BOTB1|nr:hypothetical protein BOTBODRAFT_318417 [Botryobasidium botryosum FD-172 SS1]
MSAARLPPPLAGRPPYATDEDDSVYEPQHPRPVHQPPRPNPRHSNASQYNVYDEYLSGSHDDSHSHSPPPTGPPSYPQPSAPVSPYTASPPQYSPVQRDGTQMQPQISPQARPQNLAIHIPSAPDATSPQSRRPNPGPSLIPAYMPSPFSPAPGYPANGVPPGFGGPGYYPAPPLPPPVASFTPHPLPPSTPITPYFAAPPREPFNVKFSSESQIPIMRAYNEETLLTKSQPGANGGIRERRAEGDEFWRRFSMVAHKEGSKGNGQRCCHLPSYPNTPMSSPSLA